jgi:hypothetical protein
MVCSIETVGIGGQSRDRVRYGQETVDNGYYHGLPEFCPDCHTPKGGVHHPGCNLEQCPVCGWHLDFCLCDKQPFDLAWPDVSCPPQLPLDFDAHDSMPGGKAG